MRFNPAALRNFYKTVSEIASHPRTIGPTFDLPLGYGLSDMAAVEADLTRARRYCELIIDRYAEKVADDVHEALQSAAIVTYWRAFGTSVRGRFRLDVGQLDAPLEALEAHSNVKTLRDKFVAHSVNAMEQPGLNLLLDLDANGKVARVAGVVPRMVRSVALSLGFFQDFVQLIDLWLTKLRALRLIEEQHVLRELPVDDYVGKDAKSLGPNARLDMSPGIDEPRRR